MQGGKRENSGRKKGVPNKTTKEIREGFQLLIEKGLPNMTKWLDKVADDDPAKALDLVHKFGDFIIPKLSRAEIEDVTTFKDLANMTPAERVKRMNELRSKINKNK